MIARWRGLRRALISIGLLTGLVGMTAGGVVSMNLVVDRLAQRLGPLLVEAIPAEAIDRCVAAPEQWTGRVGALRLHAFGLDGRAAAGGSRLDESLLTQMRAGQKAAAKVWFLSARGGAVALRVARTGRCAVMRMVWPRDVYGRMAGFAQLSLFVLLPIGLTTIVGVLLVLGPLSRRIAALDISASRLGEDTFESAKLDDPHALGRLSRALDNTHARILQDAAALRARADAIETHLAHIAHDLRTPLASLQLHLDHAVASAGPAARPALSRVVADSIYLAGLIEDLWVERLLALTPEPTRQVCVSLQAVVARALDRYRPLAEQRGVSMNAAWPDAPLTVRGRPLLIERALGNLVHNAFGHRCTGGHVALVLEATAEGFSLEVLDDGPGMPDPVRKGPDRPRDPNGGGLGLSITRSVCVRYGWRLTFHDLSPGTGVRIEGALSS